MISLTPIILLLRQNCPSFQNRVGGTAALTQALQPQISGQLATPHAFVTPVGGADISTVYLDDNQRQQNQRETFSITICADNSGVGFGPNNLTPTDTILALQKEIESALQGIRIEARFWPARYLRDAHLMMDTSRIWHLFEYMFLQRDDPATSFDLENQAEAIVNGVSDNTQPAETFATTAFINHAAVSPEELAAFEDTLRDFWPRAVGNPGVVDAGDPARAAAQASGQTVTIASVLPNATVEQIQAEKEPLPSPAPGVVSHGEDSVEEGK